MIDHFLSHLIGIGLIVINNLLFRGRMSSNTFLKLFSIDGVFNNLINTDGFIAFGSDFNPFERISGFNKMHVLRDKSGLELN